MTELRHDPVMAAEVLEFLALPKGGTAVDGTLGLAGHALLMAEAVGPDGRLFAFDWDSAMLTEARKRLDSVALREKCLTNADFRAIPSVLDDRGVVADGILLDLGLSSVHLDDPSRGISFREEGPLDMRMDRSKGEPAAALLNRAAPDEIERILWEEGDERWARAIAKAIVARRRENPLRTTADLVECVLAAVPPGARDKRIHPATRTFQAVRIAVTGELDELEEAITEIGRRLAPGGTLVVLTYHSGEDRPTKKAVKTLVGEGFADLAKKPQEPTPAEVARNPRSRSAKLRAVRRPSTLATDPIAA